MILDHFGKPSAKKISDNETCRNWDPTDNNENNPWNSYQEGLTNNEEPNQSTDSENENNIVENDIQDNNINDTNEMNNNVIEN